MKVLFSFVVQLAGLSALTALAESMLPEQGVFQSVRIGIGLWYLSALVTEISVILSGYGG